MSARSPGVWRGRVIADADLRHDANMFTILRWLLASAVIFSHAYVLTSDPRAPAFDPSLAILPFPVSRLAVLLFFSLSGFLVSGSLIKRGLRDFAVARALRLIPGLWVMLLVTVVVLGLLFNDASLAGLVRSPSAAAYLLRNMLLVGREYALEGVFAANPHANLVNGSLWTIPQEVRCYVALGLVGALGLLASRRLVAAMFVAGLIAHLLVPLDAVAFLEQPRALAVSFFFGVAVYLWRDRVVLSWPLAVIVVGGALLLPPDTLGQTALALAAAYAALVSAFLVPRAWHRFSAAIPDYSYGIYIYAFPTQQAAIALGIGPTPASNMATGFAITLVCAAASWHLVEKPALGLKPRLTRGSAGVRSNSVRRASS